jgi:acyl-coenzyme A thioesterase PaaI-like protein
MTRPVGSNPPALVSAADATERLQGIPFVRALGMSALGLGPGAARSIVPHCSAVARQAGERGFCEGVVAAAADQAGSVAVWSQLGLAFPHATVSLGLSFLRAAIGDRLELEARLLTIGGGLGQVAVDVTQADGQTVAHGSLDFALGSYPGDAGVSTTRPVPDPSKLGDHTIHAFAGDHIAAALGLQVADASGRRLPFQVNLVGSRDPVALHGGAIAAASVACARSALDVGGGSRLIQLTVDYLRSGLPQSTVFRPRIVSRTRRTALVEVDALQDKGARLIARSRVRFYAV